MRAREGDREAFGLLVRRHIRVAHAVARATVRNPADADDVVQEAFLEALVRLERCREPARFAGWLMTIVRNRGRNRRRYLRRREAEPLDEGSPVAAPDDPARGVAQAELRERLLDGLSGLPEAQRQVVLLHDLEGRAHAEVAESLGISEGLSRVLLHRARKYLRRLLSSDPLFKEEP
jgi:RNA polymerase sigma-70 factor (ECF subfamily)